MGFTRNYRNKMLSSFYPIKTGSKIFNSNDTSTLKNISGTIYDATWVPASDMQNYGDYARDYTRINQMSADSIVFGTSNAEESIDDYTINTISTLVYQKTSVRFIQSNNNMAVHFEYTVYNPSDITITEFGIIDKSEYSDSYSAGSADFLIYRKKLDEPINLLADAPVTISFDVVFPPII